MSVLLSRSAAKWALSTARSQSLVCPPCRLLSVSSSSSGPTSSSGTNTLSTAASSSPIAPAMGPALPSASSSTATPQTIATSSTQPSTSTPPPRPSSSSTRPPRSATLARACAGSLATPPDAAGGALAANPVWKPPADWSFYRRELPPDLVPFSSAEGRRYFAEALADGTMECYFPLAEQFMTQSEPAYCAITSLTMCLNAFGVDPGKNWKRPWRWYSEDLLECCTPMSTIRDEGLTFRQFSSLARCHGILSQDFSADKASLAHFRALLLEVATRTSTVNPALASAPHGDPSRGGLSAALVVSFSRKSLGQTGDGHMSPIAGYHAGSDSVLVLDVARFKYPSFWVSVPRLWASMLPPDRLTGRSRGYCLLSPIPRGAGARAAAAAAAADTAAAAAAAGAAARGAASGDAARVIALSTPPSPVAVAGGGAEGAWSQGGGAWSGLPPAASSPASASGSASAPGSASASASASAVAAADAAGPGYDAAAAIAAARSGIAYVPPSTAGGSDRFSLGGCGSTSCGCAEDPSAAPLPDEGALTFSTPVSAVSEVSQGSDKLSRGDTRGDTQQRSSRSTPATPSSRLSVIRAAAAAFLGRSPLSAPRIETEPREASPLPAEGSRLPLAAADAAAAAASSFLQRARAHVRRRTADRPPSSSSDAPADPPAPSSPAAPSGASAGAASGPNMGAVDGLPPSSRLRFCCPSTRAASAALASARLAFAAASPADAVPPAEGVPISGADLKLSRYPPNRVQPSAPVPAVAPAAAALALAPIARAPMPAPAPAPAPVPVPAPAPVPAPVLMPVPVLVPAGLDLEPSAAAAPVATLYSAHSPPTSSSPSSTSQSAQQCPAQCPPRIRTWTLLAQGKLVAALASGREAGTAQQRAAAASAAAGLTLPPAMP